MHLSAGFTKKNKSSIFFTRLQIYSWRAVLSLLIALAAALGTTLIVRAVANITATMTDTIIGDDGDGKADPGETIEYTTVIQNSGADPATGVTFTDIIDLNTTLVGGSLAVSPIAIDDGYTAVGNLSIAINAASGVLANDYLGLNPAATITASDTISAQGGNVTVNADGSFTYNPPPGYTGADTFTYTLNNSTGSNTGTVTITISGMVWFINNNAASCTTLAAGCGRLSHPFSSLAAFNTLNDGIGNNPAANDNIFLYESSTAYTGGVILLSGQKLIGQDSTSSLATITGLTPPTGSASFPAMITSAPPVTIQNTGGNAVTLNSGNTLNGFTASNASGSSISGTGFGTLTVADVIVNTTGQALSLTNGALSATFSSVTSTGGTNNIALAKAAGTLTGTLTISAGALSGATSNSFDINGGTATISNASTIASGSARSVNVTGLTGGTVTFSGAITDTDTGVSLTTNTGATINFIGGLSLSTGSNSAFTATGGGTVNVCDENPCNPGANGAFVNTLTTTSGTALNVANTTIGSNNLEFKSISANGASKGIILNTTGSSGGLKVVGTGTTDGTGGTIQNISSRGGEFISTNNLVLKNINFTSAATSDGDADNSGLTTGDNLLSNAPIHLQTVTTVTLDNINITGSAEQGINGNNVNGLTLSNSAISNTGNGPDEDGLHFYNLSGTNAITNTSITSSGDDNVNIQNNTNVSPISSSSTINVTGGSFNTGVLGSGLLFGIRGTFDTTINISGVTCDNNFSGGIVIDTYDTATSTLDITGVSSINNNDGISISSKDGSTKFDIHDNVSFAGNDFGRINVLKAAFSTSGTLEGRIHNNPIVVTNGQTTDGVTVQNLGAGTLKVLITNNTFDYQGTQRALYIAAGQDGNAILEATVTGNSFDIKLDGTGNAVNAILAQASVASPSGDPSSLCIDIGGGSNTFTHSLGGTLAGGDIRVRQRFVSNVRLPGYGGVGTDTTAAAAYLDGRNVEVSPSTVSINTSISGGAACQQPNYAMSPSNNLVVEQTQPRTNSMVYTESEKLNSISSFAAAFVPVNLSKQVSESNSHTALISTSTIADGSGKPLFSFAQPAPAQSGETVGPISLGTLPAGESVTIKFRVTVDNPIDNPVGAAQISTQGTVDSIELADVLTDDTAVGGTSDPTITLIDRPDTTISSINRNSPSGATTNADSVTWRVSFDDAVTNLSASNFSLATTGTITTGSIGTPVVVNSTTWDITVSTIAGDGTLGLNLVNDTGLSHDLTNLYPAAAATGELYTIDNTAPTVTSFTRNNPSSQLTNADTLIFEVTFSEAITGFGTADFIVHDNTPLATTSATATSASSGPFRVTISGGDLAGFDGIVALDFSPTMNITDQAGNALVNTEPATDETYTVDNSAPTVTNVTSSAINGSYAVGAVIPINVTFSETVTVSGGIPKLTLETGSTDQIVDYSTGSGTATLTFNYTVQAADDSADLDYVSTAALDANGGSIQDAILNDATLTLASPGTTGSLGFNKDIVIDNGASTVTNVTSSSADDAFAAGAVIPITVTFDEAVTVTGTPQLTLETGATDQIVNYTSGSGTDTLTFNYTVQAGDSSADLDYVSTTALDANGGSIRDAATNDASLTLASPGTTGSLGFNKDIVIDTIAADITNVTSTKADGTYGTGILIPITITFSESVLVTGTPQLTLETGTTDRTINYTSGSGTDTLTFNYTTQSGDITSDLDYTSASALVLNSGTVKDAASNNAILTLPTPGAAGSIGGNKDIVIDANEPIVSNVTSTTTNGSYKAGAVISVQMTFDRAVNVTGTPQLTLETGATDQAVNYTSGNGSSTLTFDYTVQAGDTTSDLDYTSTSALTLNSGTIKDASTSMDATLILPTPGTAGSLGANKAIVIDTTSPTISNVTSSTANGSYTSGAVIPISITYSEIVFVTGTPQLTLETGTIDRVINYASGSGSNTLTFNYTVQAGDTSADLDYKSTTALALNSGTIQDLATNNATLTVPTPGAAGSLGANKAIVIDNTAPNTTIDGNPSDPTNNTSATFTFSGTDISGITSFECQLDAGGFNACTSPTNFSGLSAASHTFEVRAIDNVGLTDASPSSYTWVIDLTSPSVTINLAAGQASSTSAVPINFTVIFSESVTGFTNADVDLSASTATGTLSAAVTGGPSTYNVAVTGMTGDGNVIASIPAGGATDQATNFNTGSTTSGNTVAYTYDNTPPTIASSVRANPSPTSAIHVDFTVTFSEPVTGVDVSDFSLTMSGITNAVVNSVSGSGSVYTVTINTGSNNGTIRLDVLDDNTIVDAVLNPLAGGFTAGQIYTTINKSAIFADVPYSYWANGYIERLYNAGITGGCANSPLIYCPDDKVTRAQMAVFLLKTIHGISFTPPPATGTVFNDVPTSYWAASWIEQFFGEGVTAGCGDGNYCPDAVSTTRAQMAVFLLRGRHGSSYIPPAPTGIFNDVPTDYWAAAWIEQLAAEGITNGCGGGNYCPEYSLTRAEMAIFLVRTFNFPKSQE